MLLLCCLAPGFLLPSLSMISLCQYLFSEKSFIYVAWCPWNALLRFRAVKCHNRVLLCLILPSPRTEGLLPCLLHSLAACPHPGLKVSSLPFRWPSRWLGWTYVEPMACWAMDRRWAAEMDRQQVRLSALRCGNEYKSPIWLPLSSTLSLPPFPLSPTLSPLPLFLPLSVWFRNCSICHLGFGILPSPATSETRRPLCCFICTCPLATPSSSQSPQSSPAPAP